MEKCVLCDSIAELQDSHIIPSFVGAWLKNTSITGYLRQVVNPNVRKQDLITKKLLCRKCETMLSVSEGLFKDKIFTPYLTIELDEWAIARGVIKEFEYKKWLIDFIIGLQWRALFTHGELKESKSVDANTIKEYNIIIKETLKQWKEYILGTRSDTGDTRHYIIFLQNLISGTGSLPASISEKVNMYLIRSVDNTLALNKGSIFLFTKMGPIVILSALKPRVFHRMDCAQVKMKGQLKTSQHLRNKTVNEFIFMTRPNDALSLYKISDRQEEKITTDMKNKISNASSMQQIYIAQSDSLLSKR